MDDVAETQKKASIELQRRLIHALFTFHEESEFSSKRLLQATGAIIGLTVVLAGLTAALIVLGITRSAWSATCSSPRTRSGAKPYSFLEPSELPLDLGAAAVGVAKPLATTRRTTRRRSLQRQPG
jgi:hypothetical protein